MKQVLHQFSLIWRELGLNQKISIALTGIVVIVGLTSLLLWSNKPQMKLLYGGLAEKEAGQVLSALEEGGIKYEIGGGGRSIYVPSDKVYKARMDLAAKGLPTSGGVGFEIFDRTNFGISDFVQRTNYFRALQGELARTISQVQGVRSARVLVVVPENRLLLRGDETHPTASVFVDTGTTSLNVSSISSIRSLVANAVQGLRQQDVSVVDNQGQVLSDELNSDPQLGSSSSQMKYRQQIENYLSTKVETMLSTVLGIGNAVVRVSADVNSESATVVEEKFDPENQIARTENLTEDNTNTMEKVDGAGGAVGVAQNTPQQGAAGADSSGKPTKNSTTTKTSRTQNYEINRTTTNTIKNPGTITRVTAAVFLRPPAAAEGSQPTPRTPEETSKLRQMVANALGIAARTPKELEQMVSITELPFAHVATASVAPESTLSGVRDMVGPGAALLLAAAVFLIFFRTINKTKPEQITFELIEEESVQQHLLPQTMNHKISPELLNDLIRQKPENVSATIREWLAAKPASSL